MSAAADDPILFHASCVALHGKGCLITGASGKGKSALALQLMALGADLVADDRTELRRAGARLRATCPAAIQGRIEARGVGILDVPFRPECDVVLIVDLDRRETDRLPHPHEAMILGLARPALHDPAMPHFPAAIMAYLQGLTVPDAT